MVRGDFRLLVLRLILWIYNLFTSYDNFWGALYVSWLWGVRYDSDHISWSVLDFQNLYNNVSMTMSQNFGVRERFNLGLIEKILWERQKASGQIVKFDYHQYHSHTIAAFVIENRAKTTLLDALLVWEGLDDSRFDFRQKVGAFIFFCNISTCNACYNLEWIDSLDKSLSLVKQTLWCVRSLFDAFFWQCFGGKIYEKAKNPIFLCFYHQEGMDMAELFFFHT